MSETPGYVHGASPQPLLGDTVGSLIDRIAAIHPERPALVVRAQDIRLNYRQFHAEVERVAAGLLALGLDVHRRTGASAPRRVRPEQPAHRHHGRFAMSDRGDAARRQRHASGRDHHCLRHDRNQPR